MTQRIRQAVLREGVAVFMLTIILASGCKMPDLTTHEGRGELIGEGVGAMLPVDFGISAEIGKSLGKQLDLAEGKTKQEKEAHAEYEKVQRAKDFEQYSRLREQNPEKYAKLRGGPSSGETER